MAKPHDVLGISPDASWSAVRDAYKRLAMKHHPDRHGGDATEFKRLGAAYEAIKARRASFGPFDDLFDEAAKEQPR